jgi:hypothetical protein
MNRGFVPVFLVLLAPFAGAAGALAQTPTLAQIPPQELDALRHHQPTQSEVDARERQLYGNKGEAERQAREQAQVDKLYRQLMGNAPPGAAGEAKQGGGAAATK